MGADSVNTKYFVQVSCLKSGGILFDVTRAHFKSHRKRLNY